MPFHQVHYYVVSLYAVALEQKKEIVGQIIETLIVTEVPLFCIGNVSQYFFELLKISFSFETDGPFNIQSYDILNKRFINVSQLMGPYFCFYKFIVQCSSQLTISNSHIFKYFFNQKNFLL